MRRNIDYKEWKPNIKLFSLVYHDYSSEMRSARTHLDGNPLRKSCFKDTRAITGSHRTYHLNPSDPKADYKQPQPT